MSSARRITIDGQSYMLDHLGEAAKTQLANIEFTDTRIQELNNEWAIADTARIAYTAALKRELTRT